MSQWALDIIKTFAKLLCAKASLKNHKFIAYKKIEGGWGTFGQFDGVSTIVELILYKCSNGQQKTYFNWKYTFFCTKTGVKIFLLPLKVL